MPRPVVHVAEWYHVIIRIALAHAHTCTDMVYLGNTPTQDATQRSNFI
jgi:hypothetical protein